MSELSRAMRAINQALPGPDNVLDRLGVLYQWLSDHHSGQWSPEYRVLCAVGRIYHPGLHNGQAIEEHQLTAYHLACDAAGCSHSDSF